jgi:hypothetical protein
MKFSYLLTATMIYTCVIAAFQRWFEIFGILTLMSLILAAYESYFF